MEYKGRSTGTSGTSTKSFRDLYNMKYSSYLNDEPMPDATSEKEQGNEYFKQKKFADAIECYSRSIGLSPTAVTFANRAMAYLKLRRFKEAEDDCTEALNLDDRYIKAYSRRITARKELGRPLAEYMSLPASQYSVLDAERIERVDDSTFRCYVYRFRFFALEVCPVLLVRVDEEPDGCCIRLLSCKLEGSPLVEAQNDKFSASMANRVFCSSRSQDSTIQQLTSDTTIEVAIDIPFPFRAIPVEAIESSGRQVLEQLLRVMLPRFLKQLVKDYQAWASGDASRKPLGTGEI